MSPRVRPRSVSCCLRTVDRAPHLAQPGDPPGSSHSLHWGATFLLAVKFENSAPYPHVSGVCPLAPYKPDQSLEKVGGPSLVCRAACSSLSGTRPLESDVMGDMGSTALKGFFPLMLIFVFCGAGVRWPIHCYLVTNVHLSRECWNPSPALPNTLFKLPFILTRSPRSFLNVKLRVPLFLIILPMCEALLSALRSSINYNHNGSQHL